MRSNAMNKNSLIKREGMRKLKDKNEMQAAKKMCFHLLQFHFQCHTHTHLNNLQQYFYIYHFHTPHETYHDCCKTIYVHVCMQEMEKNQFNHQVNEYLYYCKPE